MKTYEYSRGKVRIKRYGKAAARLDSPLTRDISRLMLAIAVVPIELTVVVALSVIAAAFYGFSVYLAAAVTVAASASSFAVLYALFAGYKRNASRSRTK